MLAFVILVLAVARATRVIVYDEVAQPLRAWVLRKWPLPSKPGKLVTCYWCSGFWLSALAAAATHSLFPWKWWITIPLLTFAVSYGAAWVLDKEGTDGA